MAAKNWNVPIAMVILKSRTMDTKNLQKSIAAPVMKTKNINYYKVFTEKIPIPKNALNAPIATALITFFQEIRKSTERIASR